MKIVIVGLGYVGLSNAVLLAQHNEVIGVDISEEKVRLLNARQSFIVDSELSEYLTDKDLNLTATTDLQSSVESADFVIISTPTNYDEKTKSFDTESVEQVSKQVIDCAPSACIIIKSTIPIGFTDRIRKRLNTNRIIFSPEFLREGRALHDNLYPSRIIVGDKSEQALKFAELLKKGSIKQDVDILLTGTREAEAIKLFANTYLAMRVAFFNELDTYSLVKGLDSKDVVSGISLDNRIGNQYNNPSFGFGGYCLPKDSKQLFAEYDDVPQNIIGAVVQANVTRKEFLARYILEKKPKVVGVYRLLMKAGSDNFRHSAVHDIITYIQRHNVKIILYEPLLDISSYQNCDVIKNFEQFITRSDMILANRINSELDSVSGKVFTRDIYGIDS